MSCPLNAATSTVYTCYYVTLAGSCVFSDTISLVPMLDAVVESSGVFIAPGTKQFTVVSRHYNTFYEALLVYSRRLKEAMT